MQIWVENKYSNSFYWTASKSRDDNFLIILEKEQKYQIKIVNV